MSHLLSKSLGNFMLRVQPRVTSTPCKSFQVQKIENRNPLQLWMQSKRKKKHVQNNLSGNIWKIMKKSNKHQGTSKNADKTNIHPFLEKLQLWCNANAKHVCLTLFVGKLCVWHVHTSGHSALKMPGHLSNLAINWFTLSQIRMKTECHFSILGLPKMQSSNGVSK